MSVADAVVELVRQLIADGRFLVSTHASQRGVERQIKMRDLKASAQRRDFFYVSHRVSDAGDEVILEVQCIDRSGVPFNVIVPLPADLTHIEPIITVMRP